MGKLALEKEPSGEFKKDIIISEHSPIRKLLYEIVWYDIPYFVAMHFRTHFQGFKSSEDDLYFIETQRTDRTQKERDKLPQNAPVMLRCQVNAQSMINVSRVRLCRLAMFQTREAWELALKEVKKIDPLVARACVANCFYRGHCPERKKTCGYSKSGIFQELLQDYRAFCGGYDEQAGV
jgi:hypothetical protein